MGWRDTIKKDESSESVTSKPSSWRSTIRDEVSIPESVARGAAQSATLGFADELTASGETLLDVIRGKVDPVNELAKDYRENRDESRANYERAEAANPKSYLGGEIVGGIASSALVPGSVGATLGTRVAQGAVTGGLAGLGNSESDLTEGDFRDAAIDTAIGAGAGAGISAAMPYVGKGISKAGKKISDTFSSASDRVRKFAEDKAVAATGATGVQSEKFAPNAGRELLDRKIVGFGDSAENVANKAQSAMDKANVQIDEALATLDQKGGSVRRADITAEIKKRIEALRSDPSQSPVVKKLEGIIEDIEQGPQYPSFSQAEGTKRGYQSLNTYGADNISDRATKITGHVYKNTVEAGATAADPATAKVFTDAKKTYGLLSPVQEAAARRARTLNQSPMGGLLDVSSGGAGAIAGDPTGGVATAVARRTLSPRISSSVAVSADKIAKVLNYKPQTFGKFSTVLQKSMQNGQASFATTSFLLQQREPEFQQMLKDLDDNSDVDDAEINNSTRKPAGNGP